MNEFLCKIFGHIPTDDLNVRERTARCRRCKKKLRVSYDMAYGNTVVEGEIEDD